MAGETQTIVLNNGQQAIVNTDLGEIFVRDPRMESAVYTNGTGSEVTIPIGTVLGRITASGKVLPLVSTAVDGSQVPIGIAAKTYTVANGVDQDVTFVKSGDVVENRVILSDGGDDLDTAVSGTLLRDWLQRVGVILVGGTENTFYDNN